MISLGGLVSQKAFGKFEMGKVISNPFANAFIKEAEGEDHEVSMGQNQLDTIIKMATELKAKMGENEKEIPAWIQDHISKAENYISQAAGNYHEYGTNESVNEAFEVHYSDGIRASKKFGNERQAVQFAKDLIKNKKSLQFVDVFNAGSGFNSTADTKAIVAWWGSGSYTANKAKSDSNLAKKKIDEESVPTGERIQKLNNRIKVLRDKISATKSPEQKKLFSDRLKNALQTLSNIKKDHSIKAPIKEGRSIKKIQTDYAKAVEAIQNELVLYKQHKDTPDAKKHIDNLKKLNDVKKKLEVELDNSVTSLYKDAELKAED